MTVIQYLTNLIFQEQPPRGVLKKRCFENKQQTYRRTPMPKCDFNDDDDDDDDEMMNCFFGMIDRTKVISLISSRDHCQRDPHYRESPTRREQALNQCRA